ncbi:Auxin-responsive protein IAA14 [Hordeum vulgare]|nr:Auxin-responsive protein IAA14 [Hordeum vulgare]KAI5019933.1 hypothetical protein ZWY2020_044821 [Hordeum vulgare]
MTMNKLAWGDLEAALLRGRGPDAASVGSAAGGRSASVANWVNTELRLRPPSKYVKVMKRGAPYLRKLDLTEYRGYEELSAALGELFGLAGDFSVTYQLDEDGDFMLAGDLPWGDFVSKCKKLTVSSPGEPIYE